MNTLEIINYFKKVAKTYANSSDEYHGFQAKLRHIKNVKAVLFTISPSLDAIKFSIKKRISLIISYYPLMPKEIMEFPSSLLEKLALLIENHIVLYVFNKEFWVVEDGIIDIVRQKLYLDIVEPFYQNNSSEKKIIGRICAPKQLPYQNGKLSLKDLIERIKKYLEILTVKYSGDLEVEVKNICMSKVINSKLLKEAKKEECNCFITQEFSDNNRYLARDLGINLIELTHSQPIIKAIEQLQLRMGEQFRNIEFLFFDSKDSYVYM